MNPKGTWTGWCARRPRVGIKAGPTKREREREDHAEPHVDRNEIYVTILTGCFILQPFRFLRSRCTERCP